MHLVSFCSLLYYEFGNEFDNSPTSQDSMSCEEKEEGEKRKRKLI